ncbi:hypothetical protein VTI74DRAFT_10825 [Chaetomium olivicolor]
MRRLRQRPSSIDIDGDNRLPASSRIIFERTEGLPIPIGWFTRLFNQYFPPTATPTSTSAPISRKPSKFFESSKSSKASTRSSPSKALTPASETAEDPYKEVMAVWDAQEYLRAFINEHWPSRSNSITIDCSISIDELRAIGQLPKSDGVLACRRLLRVPVINEEVGLSLYERLVKDATRSPSVNPAKETEEAAPSRSPSVHSMPELRKTTKERKISWKRPKKQHQKQNSQLPQQQQEKYTSTRPGCPLCPGICSAFPVDAQPITTSVTTGSATHTPHTPPPSQHHKDDDSEPFWQQPEPPKPRRLSDTTLLSDASTLVEQARDEQGMPRSRTGILLSYKNGVGRGRGIRRKLR